MDETDTTSDNPELVEQKRNTLKKAEVRAEWSSAQRAACRLLIVYHLVVGVIRDGMGPLVNTYLVSARSWDPSRAGIIWFIREISMFACFIPMGMCYPDWCVLFILMGV